MMWILGGAYCLVLWLIFAKFRLIKLSLPIAIIAASIGPAGILALLFCAQYFHPFTTEVRAFQFTVPIAPQMKQPGRVSKIHVQANVPIKKGDLLFEVDPVPFENAVRRLTSAVVEAEQGVKVAEANIEVSATAFKRATTDLAFATGQRERSEKLAASSAISKEEMERDITRHEQARAALEQAITQQAQASLSVDAAKAKLEQVKASLADSQYDLEQSKVFAPSDGFVTNLQLQVGMLIGGPGATPIMSFVKNREDGQPRTVTALFTQKNYLLIKPGQYAEVVLDAYPGQVLTGKVIHTIDINGAGQLTATGDLPEDLGNGRPTAFAVRIQLDDSEELRLPAGIQGCAAVYTDRMQIAGIPIMFVIRAESWLKFVF